MAKEQDPPSLLGTFTLGNPAFELIVGTDLHGNPAIKQLKHAGLSGINWAAPGGTFEPELVINEIHYTPGTGNMSCQGIDLDKETSSMHLEYRLSNGLDVFLHLQASRDKPVWRTWVTLRNPTSEAIGGITRFDAANWRFSHGARQPQCSYVLGWMEGPRADAPGRQPLPFKYGGWIPKFLYGEGFVIPPPPEGGWAAPVYRLVQERLGKLPLQSGKRSTYINHPWVAVLDEERGGGWLLGFEWSGSWKIDVEYQAEGSQTGVAAWSDGNVHELAPGSELVSPGAFIGLFVGGWDEAFNLSRWYVDDEIIPKIKPVWPTTLHVYYFQNDPGKRSDAYMRREIDAAAEAGFESTYIETIWWNEGALSGDFSIGLGDFSESRIKFPMGLRGMAVGV